MEDLPKSAVTLDRRLDKAAESTTVDLCQHRWHWTLDESNAKRVSLRAYARAVGVSISRIRAQVNGYVDWTARGGARTLAECIERASIGVEKQAAIEAVAKASGTSFGNTRKSHSGTVQTARALAEERAQRRGTSVSDEIEGAAAHLVKSAKAVQNHKADRKSKLDARYIEIEGHIAAAIRRLRAAVDVARDIELDAPHVEVLTDSIKNLRSVTNLLDVAITGTTEVDWDAELAALPK